MVLPNFTVKQLKISGFDSEAPCALAEVIGGGGRGGRGRGAEAAPTGSVVSQLKKATVARCDVTLKVPAGARISEPYWHRQGEAGRYTFDADAPFGLPYRPTPFHAQIAFGFNLASQDPSTEEVIADLPIQHRYEGDIFSGEKRSELLVVPAVSVRVSPEIAIVPVASLTALPGASQSTQSPTRSRRSFEASAKAEREVRVTVVNNTPGASEGVMQLNVPAAWSVSPQQQAMTFVRQDESQTVRFAVKPAADTAPGAYHVRAVVSSAGRTFERGYQTIEYPHIRRQHIYHDADVTREGDQRQDRSRT